MRVRYFDLGCNRGETVQKAISQLEPMCDLQVHAIDANPKLAEACRKRFDRLGFVYVHNFAITEEKKKVSLYLSSDPSLLGSSIFSDKNNVGEKEVVVDGIPFSEFFSSLGKWDGLNVLKANIEGAEMFLVRDMIRNKLFPKFCLLLGSSRSGGWTKDMVKIPSICGEIRGVEEEMSSSGIVVKTFFCSESDVNIAEEIKRVVDETN